ncbi:MAG: hypothetical protein QOE93_1464 [Actinomycetota bacterium]|nr:hypothetical protein [Actinomycetota bacterium]
MAAALLGACSAGADDTTAVRAGAERDAASTVFTTESDLPQEATSLASSDALTLPVSECRNSHDPDCGPFHFDGPLEPDRPMTVGVMAVPGSPRVGEAVTFHLVLEDPDGVSYGGTIFHFGPSAIGSTLGAPCAKFGAWDPPPFDSAHATEVQDVRHVYDEPGTYTARFTFEAGPDGCLDAGTGRGEHPYASTATGVVTVVVQP